MTSLIRFSPTTDMRRLQREIDSLFESFFPTRSNGEGTEGTWSPRVDVSETDDMYTFQLDIPGMRKDDLEISYQDGTLTVSGERRFEDSEENRKYVRVERAYGRFYRSFSLPQAIQEDKIKATFKDGVLTIDVPKAEETKPRRIKVS